MAPSNLPVSLSRSRNVTIAEILTLYIICKQKINDTFDHDVRCILDSTLFEYHLEQSKKPCRPPPESINDFLQLVKVACSAETRRPLLVRLLHYWLGYLFLLPLFILSRLSVYMDELYWLMVFVGRTWKARKSTTQSTVGMKAALKELARQELALSVPEAETLVAKVVLLGDLGTLVQLFDR